MKPNIDHDVTGAPADPTTDVRCTHCGAEAEPSWEFCGSCGHRLDTAAPQAPEPPSHWGDEDQDTDGSETVVLADLLPASVPAPLQAPAEEPRRRRRSPLAVTLYSLGAVVLLAAVTGASYAYQQTVNDLETTRAELGSTRDELDTTNSTLAETEDSLTDSRSELADTSNQLQQAQTRLRSARRNLSGLQGSLNNAQDRLDLQANQIETLKSCLDGVTTAMSYAAYSNYGAAIAALDAVEVSCNRAYELF